MNGDEICDYYREGSKVVYRVALNGVEIRPVVGTINNYINEGSQAFIDYNFSYAKLTSNLK